MFVTPGITGGLCISVLNGSSRLYLLVTCKEPGAKIFAISGNGARYFVRSILCMG